MKNHFAKPWSLILLLALVAAALVSEGCSSLHAELPSSRFESPESNGAAHRFQLNANAMQAQNVTLSPDASARPPDFSSTKLESDTLVGFGGSYAIFDHLDFGLRTTTGPSPYIGFVKYQFIGPTSSEAKQGDFSAALSLGAGGGDRKSSGDQNGVFGPGGYNWSAKVSNTVTDIALIIGQRIAATTVLYAGGFYSNYKISAQLDQDASSSGSPAASYSAGTSGFQRGANVGLQFFLGPPFFLQVEGVYSDTHASNRDNSALRLSGALGWLL